MLKEMAGNGFHLNIVGALGMFALANVVPRDQVDGQIPGAIEWKPEGEDEDGDEPGEPSLPKARRLSASGAAPRLSASAAAIRL